MSSQRDGPRTKETLEVPQKDTPHSGLVDLPCPPARTPLSTLNTAGHASLLANSQLLPPLSSPPIPARSPLRPAARSISSSGGNSGRSSRRLTALDPLATPPSSAIDDSTIIVDPNSPADGRNSFSSMTEQLMEALSASNVLSKPLAARPTSSVSYETESRPKSQYSTSSSSSAPPPGQATMTKRQHALLELLSSERAYAADLALIKGVHMRLAEGLPPDLSLVAGSSHTSSDSSSRTLSTASDSSAASLGPPMTEDDVQKIFTNIPILAAISDQLCEELEAALGSLLKGGTGEDRVGALFCEKWQALEGPYDHYITRHANALRHLQSLPPTPALEHFLSETKTLAAKHSHAWDLASLLIKPVQRLMKYPLLLSTLIDETPDTHPDKAYLKRAKIEMEQIAVRVNEGRRRKEVVEEVLASVGKKSVNVSAVASVNLGKVKNLRTKTEKEPATLQVDNLEGQLKGIEVFARQVAKDAVEWARYATKVVGALRAWSNSFGKVIGLSDDQESEAFEAFVAVVESQLMPLCVDLEAIISERLLKEIAHLLTTMSRPYKLLASMHEQEPLHYHYLTMPPASKGRQAHAAMQAASLNYVALRAQLLEDLPHYLALLHKGMAISVRRLADIQMRFWKDVKDKWGELWEMLRVDGELNAGFEETINVWSARWMDVNDVLSSLNICSARKIYQEPERARPPTASGFNDPSRRGATDILSSLDPAPPSYAGNYVSSPMPLSPSIRSRGRTSEESSHRLIRRTSNDSLHSTVRAKGKSPARRGADRDENSDYFGNIGDYSYHQQAHAPHHPYSNGRNRSEGTASMPAIPRRKSMPLSEIQSARRATSPGDYEYHQESPFTPPYANHPYGAGTTTEESYEHTRHPSSGNRGRPLRSTSRRRTVQAESRVPDSHPLNGGGAASPFSIPSAPNGKPQRPAHNRNRSSSITSFFKGKSADGDPALPQMPDSRHLQPAHTDQWAIKAAKYVCQVIHPCTPPAEVSYFSFPFFPLQVGVLYEVLQEAGHPSIHPKLPLYVDEGEDCLLLCRDMQGKVGWALASFLEPVNIPVSR